ncbi:MAG: T9SS type A sorting domain-containing protein [Bacteroidota bacterium]|nr:T9SS type A sorting domain-containing protein [Bacteroidota bacterium]
MLLQTLWLGILCLSTFALAQVPPASKVAIPLRVTLDRSSIPVTATIRWRHDPDYEGPYTVLVRQRGIEPQFSPVGSVTPMGDSATFTFELSAGTLYEVGVLNSLARTINGQQVRFTAAGYTCVGDNIPVPPFRGRVLLVVDSTVADHLRAELAQLSEDLDREGWRVDRVLVPRAERFSAAAVRRTKDSILAWYRRGNPDEPATVFLIGRIAVPYSGLYYNGQYIIPPDGHNPDHRGAWPADGYYGTLSEYGWTDQVADTAGVVREENRNLPGDGKFDNVFFPTPVELRVGRVDFYNLPRLTPAGSTDQQAERELLRNYFSRNHAYRTGSRQYQLAGLIDDNFPTYPELFARSGWISFPPLVGASNVRAEKWFPTLDTSSRLLAYGCGAGSYTSANGIGGLNEFSTRRVNAAFTMLFGSYFGDWDSQNNLMRVNLARGALTCSWSGRPVWYLHPMAAGETIGDITMMVQNFSPFVGQSVYVSSNAQGWIHVALLGDPTLRIYYGRVPPPRQLSVRQEGRSIHLEWQSPQLPSDSLVGYYVYRTLPNGREVALTPEPITDTRFTDTYRTEGVVRYAVRCVGRIRTPSGLIHDLSPAVRAELFTTSVEQANEIPAEVSVVVAPNPVSDVARVTIRTSKPTLAHAQLYSLDGRQLATLLHTTVVDEATVMWDTSLLSAGVYMIGVRTSEGATVLHPIVVAH